MLNHPVWLTTIGQAGLIKEEIVSKLGLALWNSPISKITMTKEDLRKFLLEHQGKIIVNGKLRTIKSKHIGAGIYEVQTETISYKD